jgi:uncharacterized protein
MKARDQAAVAALRSALAAIDNAEAVEVTDPPLPAPPPGQAPTATPNEGPGSGERMTRGTEASPGAGSTGVAGAVVGLGAGEVERRRLTTAEMEAIVRREVAERRAAARAYEGVGQSRYAERLRAEADLLGAYLDDPDPPT